MASHLQRRDAGIVGRKHEQDRLGALLDSVEWGNGSVALISGEAGVGKTTLVRDLVYQAKRRSWVVLQGGCYDLTATPPYGPWVEVTRNYDAAVDGLPELPEQLRYQGGIAEIRSQAVLFELFNDFFARISSQIPLLIVIEDLHWGDPASLELLRFLGRNWAEHRILLMATYRDEELSPEHELARTLPALVRESRPERLHLPPLDRRAVRQFIASRYDLDTGDLSQLTEHVWERADGNPFFASEILQGLEDEQRLQHTLDGWQLGDIELARVPSLLRQVIDNRLARLSSETHEALQIAAVIGQEIRLSIWQEMSNLSRSDLDTVLAEASEADLLEEMPTGSALQFRHALLREALYESLTLRQRRAWHRRTGEALATGSPLEPDSVAYHFQQARDPRAKEWLLQAGEHAQRTFAWLTAADRFAQALTWTGEDSAQALERAWLLYRIGGLLRHSDRKRARSFLERAYQLANVIEDDLLIGYVLWELGRLRWLSGDMRRGLEEMASGDQLLDKVPADHAPIGNRIGVGLTDILPVLDLAQLPDTKTPTMYTLRGTRIAFAAHTGHIELVGQLGESYLRQVATVQKPSMPLLGSIGDAYFGLAVAEAILGNPVKSWQWLRRSLRIFRSIGHHFMIAIITRFHLYQVGVTYDATDFALRRELIEESETALQQSAGVHPPELPGNFGEIPVLVIEGQWKEARRIAEIANELVLDGATAQMARALLAEIAFLQGDSAVSLEQVRAILPDGPATEPGDCYFLAGLHLQRTACSLALEAHNLDKAGAWAEAHDCWLEWNGAVLGRADGQLLWARYHQLEGDRDAAQARAETALRQATDPRQPRAQLAAHRFLGMLATQQRHFNEAEQHLSQALDLAQQCNAPFERALTLLELSELRLKQGRLVPARIAVDEAREIGVSLEAAPMLARAEELTQRIESSETERPDGLTPREMDVLRLLAADKSNREIADDLFLSVRTIERHVANIYNKIDVHNRLEAASYAQERGLTPSEPTQPRR